MKVQYIFLIFRKKTINISAITPEKMHALLEKLAEYVMNEVATQKELVQKVDKADFIGLKQALDEIKQNVKGNKIKLNIIIDVSAQKNSVKMRRTSAHQFVTDLKIEC